MLILCMQQLTTSCSAHEQHLRNQRATIQPPTVAILLHNLVEGAAPGRPCGNLGTVGVNLVPVMLTSASIDVNLVDGEPAGSLPEPADSPEKEHDRKCKVRLEEALNRTHTRLTGAGNNGSVEL